MARLVLNHGTEQSRELVLKPGTNSLGRREENDFTISDPSVSGAHCQIVVSDGNVRLRDLGSTNGTFVDGARINEADLKSGQKMHLGSVELVFEADDAATPIAAAVASTARAAPMRLRLGHAGTAASAVTTAEPDVAVEEPPVTPAFEAPSNAKCKYHPKTLARWICTSCHKTYCDLCVTTRTSAGAAQKFCQSCGGMAAPLEVELEIPQERSFFREVPRAFGYPFRGAGPLILIVVTLLFAALDTVSARTLFFIIGLIIKVVAVGYLYSWLQSIIHTTAVGDDNLPDLPAPEGVLSGFFRLLGTVLVSFGPAMVVAYFAISQEEPMAGIALIPAIILGCIYLPMAFLAVAMKDTVMASNPLIIIPSIIRVPLEYILTVILVAALFGMRWLGDFLIGTMSGPFSARSMAELFIVFGVRSLWALLSFYLLTVTMRILGLLYLTKRDRLGW